MFRYHNETEGNENKDSGSIQHVMVKGSLRGKLPPSLNIKSADLKVLDPIGQGKSI